MALGLLLLVHDQCIEPFKTGYFKNDQSIAYPYKVHDFVCLFVCSLCLFVCWLFCLFVTLYSDVETGCPCMTGILWFKKHLTHVSETVHWTNDSNNPEFPHKSVHTLKSV